MAKKTYKNLIRDIISLIIFPIIFLITQNEFIISGFILFLAFIAFKIKYHKNEIKLFTIGIFLGIIMEIGGDLIFKMQYWDNASFFGIPIWLPLLWGYAFVFIRRIGNHIVH